MSTLKLPKDKTCGIWKTGKQRLLSKPWFAQVRLILLPKTELSYFENVGPIKHKNRLKKKAGFNF